MIFLIVLQLTFTTFLTVGTNTFVFRQANQWSFTLANDKHVTQTKQKISENSLKKLPSSKRSSGCVLDVNDVERSRMTFVMTNNTDTTNVTTGSDHAQVASFKLHEIGYLSSSDVQNNSVVDLKNNKTLSTKILL